MRCLACNIQLNDYEATRKYTDHDEFIDLCNRCYAESDIDAVGREDLLGVSDEHSSGESSLSEMQE